MTEKEELNAQKIKIIPKSPIFVQNFDSIFYVKIGGGG